MSDYVAANTDCIPNFREFHRLINADELCYAEFSFCS